MKDSRFIELLNLYIDRQITAEETAELEAEIQRHPKRQAVYRQYCQIHSATKLVYESFRAVAADQSSTPAGRSDVVELFETRRRRAQWTYYAGGAVAAAACIALVFMRQSPSVAPTDAPVLADKAATPAVVVAAVPPAPAVELVRQTEPNHANLRNATEPAPDYSAMIAAMREQDEERAFSNERLHIDRLQPLFNDDMFAGRRVLSQDQRTFRSPQTTATPQAESAAFQFVC